MSEGRVAGNSGQHPVSSAPTLPGESGIRERLDRPAAFYPRTPSRVRMPEPFAEFYRAIRGGGEAMYRDWWK